MRIIGNPVRQPPRLCRASHHRIGIISNYPCARQKCLNGKADRAAKQAQPDYGDLPEGRVTHFAASHICRMASAISSICASVPMVMRSACGRPCPGSQRVM